MMWGASFPAPDFDEMRRSWRRASSSQKAVRVGLVGGLVGTAIYLYLSGRGGDTFEAPLAPQTSSQGRGRYR